MTANTITDICAAAVVAIACASDVRSRRIPNWLTLSGAAAGILLHAATGGFAGVGVSLEGMFLVSAHTWCSIACAPWGQAM